MFAGHNALQDICAGNVKMMAVEAGRESERRVDERGDRGRGCYVWKGWGMDLFAILPNPGSITHQHHLSPFTLEVSCLHWTAGCCRVLAITGGGLGTLPQSLVCTDRTGSVLQAAAEVEGWDL